MPYQCSYGIQRKHDHHSYIAGDVGRTLLLMQQCTAREICALYAGVAIIHLQVCVCECVCVCVDEG